MIPEALESKLSSANIIYDGEFGVVAEDVSRWVERNLEKTDAKQLHLFKSPLDSLAQEISKGTHSTLAKRSTLKGKSSGTVGFFQYQDDVPIYVHIGQGRPRRAGVIFSVSYNSSDHEASYWVVNKVSSLLVPESTETVGTFSEDTTVDLKVDSSSHSFPVAEQFETFPEDIILVHGGKMHGGWKAKLVPEDNGDSLVGVAYGYNGTVVYVKPAYSAGRKSKKLGSMMRNGEELTRRNEMGSIARTYARAEMLANGERLYEAEKLEGKRVS